MFTSINQTVMLNSLKLLSRQRLLILVIALYFAVNVSASIGDRLPEFRKCVEVNFSIYQQEWNSDKSRFAKLRIACQEKAVCVRCTRSSSERCLTKPSPTPETLLVELCIRMRLHVSTHHHWPTTCTRPSDDGTSCAISRQMAILPVHGHARALFSPLLTAKLPCPSQWHGKNTERDSWSLLTTTILSSLRIFWTCKLDFQHDLSHSWL